MASEWYCQIDGEEHGPLSADQVRTMAQIGQLTRESLVRKGLTGQWTSALRVRGLFEEGEIPVAAMVDVPVARLLDAVPVVAAPVARPSVAPAAPRARAAMMRVRDVGECLSDEERKKRLGVIITNVLFWIILIILTALSMGGILIAFLIGWVINHLLAEYNVRKLQAYGTAASADQFPEIAQALSDICTHFGMRDIPKVIILNNPMLNAFAVKFARK